MPTTTALRRSTRLSTIGGGPGPPAPPPPTSNTDTAANNERPVIRSKRGIITRNKVDKRVVAAVALQPQQASQQPQQKTSSNGSDAPAAAGGNSTSRSTAGSATNNSNHKNNVRTTTRRNQRGRKGNKVANQAQAVQQTVPSPTTTSSQSRSKVAVAESDFGAQRLLAPLLPPPNSTQSVQSDCLTQLKAAVSQILRMIMNEAQLRNEADDDHESQKENVFRTLYKSVDRVYNFCDDNSSDAGWKSPAGEGTLPQPPSPSSSISSSTWTTDEGGVSAEAFAKRYRSMVCGELYKFGGVVWKSSNNRFADNVSRFLDICFLHLGWDDRVVAVPREHGGGYLLDTRQQQQLRGKKAGGKSHPPPSGEQQQGVQLRPTKKSTRALWKRGLLFETMVEGRWRNGPTSRPASFNLVMLFKTNCAEVLPMVRVRQLELLGKLVSRGMEVGNAQFLKHVYEHAGKTLIVRLKDKSFQCRIQSLSVLSMLVFKENKAIVMNEIKYAVRYDPSAEVRRVGTSIISSNTDMRARFFYDQAFDPNFGVRLEAFRAMVREAKIEEPRRVEETTRQPQDAGVPEDATEPVDDQQQGWVESPTSLVRDMRSLNSTKLCRMVIWGIQHCEGKVADLVRKDLLPRWLEKSCKNNLHSFLVNLDAYSHLKTVLKVLDSMFIDEGGRPQTSYIEEKIDLSFIDTITTRIKAKDYSQVTIEKMVAWLSLVKVSAKVDSIRNRVLPRPEEIVTLTRCLHECVVKENVAAKKQEREEDVTPIFCLIIMLAIGKYGDWEELTRRDMSQALENILLDPILDEKSLVVQAMHTLYELVDRETFDDLMLPLLQEMFDPKPERIRELEKSRLDHSDQEDPAMDLDDDDNEELAFSVAAQQQSPVPAGGQEEEPPPSEPEPPQLMTPFQLTSLKDKIGQLGMQRFHIENKVEELMKQKDFLATIPLNEEASKIREQELKLKAELQFQVELAKRPQPPPPPTAAAAVQLQPHHPLSPSSSNGSSAAGVGKQTPKQLDGSSSTAQPSQEEDAEELQTCSTSENDQEDGPSPGKSRRRRSSSSSTSSVSNLRAVIGTVEEGLGKALIMLNGYMDYRPGINPLTRNIYDNFVPEFMAETDANVRMSVMFLLTRVALEEKRELRPVAIVLLKILTVDAGGQSVLSDSTEELRCVAFRSLVDLLVRYSWEDFLLNGKETPQELSHPSLSEFSTILKAPIESATVRQIREVFLGAVLNYQPKPENPTENNHSMTMMSGCGERGEYSATVSERTTMIKYQGLLKLFMRGRLRDPYHLSRILILWANVDYAGTALLQDLENVLRAFKEFHLLWVGDNFERQPELEELEGENLSFGEDCPVRSKYPLRLLGKALVLAIINFCKELGAGRMWAAALHHNDEDVQERMVKFTQFGLSFLEQGDQCLLRSMATDLLDEVVSQPTRSWNSLLVRCTSQIPIMSRVSADVVVRKLDDCYGSLTEHPLTRSLISLRKELKHFENKLERVFGPAAMKLPEGRRCGRFPEFEEDNEEDQVEGEEEQLAHGDDHQSAHFSSDDDDEEHERDNIQAVVTREVLS